MATVVLSGPSTRTITADVASSGGTATGRFITHIHTQSLLSGHF